MYFLYLLIVAAMVNGLPTNEEIDERLKFVQEQANPPVKNILESILIDRMENWSGEEECSGFGIPCLMDSQCCSQNCENTHREFFYCMAPKE